MSLSNPGTDRSDGTCRYCCFYIIFTSSYLEEHILIAHSARTPPCLLLVAWPLGPGHLRVGWVLFHLSSGPFVLALTWPHLAFILAHVGPSFCVIGCLRAPPHTPCRHISCKIGRRNFFNRVALLATSSSYRS